MLLSNFANSGTWSALGARNPPSFLGCFTCCSMKMQTQTLRPKKKDCETPPTFPHPMQLPLDPSLGRIYLGGQMSDFISQNKILGGILVPLAIKFANKNAKKAQISGFGRYFSLGLCSKVRFWAIWDF